MQTHEVELHQSTKKKKCEPANLLYIRYIVRPLHTYLCENFENVTSISNCLASGADPVLNLWC